MAAKYRNVHDTLLYEYAKLIADAAVAGRPDRAPVDRRGGFYWSFVARTFSKLATGEISPSSIVRENKLMVTSGQECAYCGSAQNLQWEHIIPKSRRGPDTIDNLVLSCAGCNNQKGTMNPIEWYEKRGLHRRHVPRLVMGKLLKLVLDEHARRGTLESTDFPQGRGLGTSRSCLVFEFRAKSDASHHHCECHEFARPPARWRATTFRRYRTAAQLVGPSCRPTRRCSGRRCAPPLMLSVGQERAQRWRTL